MTASPLAPDLAILEQRERSGERLPLAVERFRSELDASTTIAAMQRATSKVLQSYAADAPPRVCISAERLCRVCGLALRNRPSRIGRRTTYLDRAGAEMTTSHTGALRLDALRPTIQLPTGIDFVRGRVSVCHEIGHYLMHLRGESIDSMTSRLPSSPEEEALAEYAARLLLMPLAYTDWTNANNIAIACLQEARRAEVTLFAAATRLGDPDRRQLGGVVRGAIFWRMNPAVSRTAPAPERMTPHWHLCAGAFVPVKRCHAKRSSLVGELSLLGGESASGSRIENVAIGSFKGAFRVDAFAWGSVARGTRSVLSVFVDR